MQQTLLALAGITIMATLSLNQQRSIFLVQRSAYVREMESAAQDFARLRLQQIIETAAFDESVVGTSPPPATTANLTTVGQFGPESNDTNAGTTTFDDLDDYHNFSETQSHLVNDSEFQFKATFTIRYINTAAPEAAATAPTLAKEITAEVVSVDTLANAVPRVTLKQIVAISDYL